MIAAPPPRDLIALVADGQMKAALEGILARHESLSIRPVTSVLSSWFPIAN